RGGSLVAPEEKLLASFGVLLVRLNLGISSFQFCQKLLTAGHDFRHTVPVIAVHDKAFLIDLWSEALSSNEPPEIAQRCRHRTAKEPSQFLADEVVQLAHLIVSIDFQVLVHVLDP